MDFCEMEDRALDSIDFPQPLIWSLGLLTVAIIFKSFNQLDADYDLWWHIFIGKQILLQATIQPFDIYSFTAFRHPYINHEWLSEIIMTGFYSMGKNAGLIFWRWIMAGMILLLSLNLVKQRAQHNLSRIIVFLLIALVLGPGISFRVQLFSYVFLLILLNLVYSTRLQRTCPLVIIVSILFIIWANLHGAFVLGLLIYFIYITERIYFRRLKTLPWTELLALLIPITATLINPYGAGLWGFVYDEISNPVSSRYITEWRHFAFAPREIPFFITASLTWIAYFFSGRKKGIAETAVLVLASIMGIMAVRNTPLFVILTLPTMAYHLDGAILRISGKSTQGKPLSKIPVYASALMFLSIAAFFFAQGLPERWQISIGKDPLPVQSAAFIKANDFKGNLWVPLHFGGYVLFHLYPDIKVSIDGRWTMVYPRDVMKDNMAFAFHGTGGKWKEVLEKYGADFALVETKNPAIREMSEAPDWQWVFSETSAGLLVKKDYLRSHRFPLRIPPEKPPSWP